MQTIKSNPDLQQKLVSILTSKNTSLRNSFPDNILDFHSDIFPLRIREMFPGYSHYLLELGSGWGDFCLEYARQNPETLCIALDKKKYRIKKSAKEQFAAGIKNIRWLVCHFDWKFENLFLPDSFDKIIINFPDPWPKKRHQKNRFIRPDFVKELALIARSGSGLNGSQNFGQGFYKKSGELEFATDNWKYMEDALQDFLDSHCWENIHGENVVLPFLANRPASFFEILKRQEKENIYFIQLGKK